MARKKPRVPDPMNPFDGRPGLVNRINRVVYRYAGPAQVGIGRAEAPYVPPADPRCPLCGESMARHDIDRSGERTQLHCPTAGS
ncbi:hypothetical protein N1031_13415 [Herbiconiux moechotypicola]|nr:hypothetical protein [Herbiconiux moechotypicola]MCS5730762.1 hypothetical protein [Herbiconiux moechotypicola]